MIQQGLTCRKTNQLYLTYQYYPKFSLDEALSAIIDFWIVFILIELYR